METNRHRHSILDGSIYAFVKVCSHRIRPEVTQMHPLFSHIDYVNINVTSNSNSTEFGPKMPRKQN